MMGTYENRGTRPQGRDGVEARAYRGSPLADRLVAALFEHHRDLVPRELESRLLPMCIKQPDEPVAIKRNVFKRRPTQTVICLPDLSHLKPFNITKPKPKNKLLAERIITDVCQRYAISEREFKSHHRNDDLIAARQQASYLIAEHTDLPLAAMGRLMSRDHTTIIHSIARYCEINHCDMPRGAAWKKRRPTK